MRHPLLTRALAAGTLSVATVLLTTPAYATAHPANRPQPQPRSGGSTVTNSITSNSSSNCATGTDPGCATTVTVTPKPPTVNPGPYPTTGPIDGTGTPGDPINLTDGAGNTICTTTVLADGMWNCTPTTPLPPGTQPLTPVDTAVSPNIPGTPTEVTFESSAVTVPMADPGALAVFGALGAGTMLLRRTRQRRRAATTPAC